MGSLIHEADGGAASVVDAGYGFLRLGVPEVDVVPFATGDREHLRANIGSILKPPLPEPDCRILAEHFGHLVSIGRDTASSRTHGAAAPRSHAIKS